MWDQILQFLLTGVTLGSSYALVALGFAIIYNASDVVNLAQGEFVMLGAMSAIALSAGEGLPLPLAILLAVGVTLVVGLMLQRFAIAPAKGITVVGTIIITIGASIFLRGLALLLWGKDIHALPHFSGETPLRLGEVTLLPQNLWVMGGTALLVLGVHLFFNRTLLGKAILACACNKTAAQLVGINVSRMLLVAYGLSALLGPWPASWSPPSPTPPTTPASCWDSRVSPPPSWVAWVTPWAPWPAVCSWVWWNPWRRA